MNYTKTAVSIPRDVFECGELAAAELGVSRSELYARALRSLLRERKFAAARTRLNEALASVRADDGRTPLGQDMHEVASTTIHSAAEPGVSTL